MKLIPLTKGQFAKVDDEDFEWLSQGRWYARFKKDTKSFYAYGDIYVPGKKSKRLQMSRVVLGLIFGSPLEADHINGDTLDNRKSNLRAVCRRVNATNLRKHRNGKLVGTYKNKESNTFGARILIGGKRAYLGSFPTELEAHQRYLQELNKIDPESFLAFMEGIKLGASYPSKFN